VDISYGPPNAVPGTRLYLSGTVAGGLDTVASVGGVQPIAKVNELNNSGGLPHAVIRVSANR